MSHMSEVIKWGTSSSREKAPATDLLWELPAGPGEERERRIRDIVLRGDVPDWLQTWVSVPVQYGKLSGEFYCSPDFLSIGNDEDFVRVRVNPVTAEDIIQVANAMLPTRKMVNAIYASSSKLEAQPWGPPYDASMMQTSRWRVQDDKIARQASSRGYKHGKLWAGHLKNMVVGRGVGDKNGATVGIYGWFRNDGEAIQGPGINFTSHEWTYTDYAHGTRLIHKDMLVNNQPMAVRDVLNDPALAPLISDEGVLKHCSYSEFHPKWLS